MAQNFLNGPIRKVITLKVKFEDLQIFFYFTRSLARHLEIFRKFFEKTFLAQNFLNGPIQVKIILKVKFEDLRIFPMMSSLKLMTENFWPHFADIIHEHK